MRPTRETLRSLIRDVGAFCVLAVLSLAAGLLINLTRSQPLPWRYAGKEKRLEHAVRGAGTPSDSQLPGDRTVGTPRTIELEEFQRLVTGKHALVLDARTDTFYQLGHVPGALNLSRENFEKEYAAIRVSLAEHKSQPIAVYCSSADCHDSDMVAEALSKLGYNNVLVYPGGWEQWTAAGLPQEPPAKEAP